MNATNALDEILRAAYYCAIPDGGSPIRDVPMVVNGVTYVYMDDGTKIRLVATVEERP